MADYLGEDETQEESQEQESIKLGDAEYTQEELNELVGLGQTARELEEKWNTKIDSVYPEFTKKSQRLKELESELEEKKELEEKLAQYQNQSKQTGELDERAIQEARQAAKKIGLLTKDDLAELGIVTRDDYKKLYKEMRSGEQLLEEMGQLEREYTGEDGRPKFDTEAVLEYMQETGINDPQVAYKVKYEDELTKWREQKYEEAKKPGVDTLGGSTAGSKKPSKVRPNKDNLGDLVSQAIEGKI